MYELVVKDNSGKVELRQDYQTFPAAFQEAELYRRDNYDDITITQK